MNWLDYYQRKFDASKAVPFTVPSEFSFTQSPDGVRIGLCRLEGEGPRAFLVVHGLLGSHRAPGISEFAQSLTRFGEVWTMDLRGHGTSGGRSTLGNLEALDVAAATRFIREISSLPIVIIGFSMGAAAAIRSAALLEKSDGVISVSSLAKWDGERRWAARRTALIWQMPMASTLVEVITGVRIEPKWKPSESPASVIGKVSPAPVLIVHGTRDHFFPQKEAETLYQSAELPRGKWIIEGGGHAEGLFIEPRRPTSPLVIDAFTAQLMEKFEEVS